MASVPGTAMLTYCPGRNASLSRCSIRIRRSTVVSESRFTAVTVPVWVAAAVFATSEVVAICRTRSDRGLAWQASR